jgi:hypothetical protein
MKRIEEITLPFENDQNETIDLPTELVIAIQKMGRGSLVLLEGNDDCTIFDKLFKDYSHQLSYYNAGGCRQVEKILAELLKVSTKKQIYGIIDRDYRLDHEVANSYLPDSHLFIMIYFELENYLIANTNTHHHICEWLYTMAGSQPNTDSFCEKIKEIALYLKYLTAAEWCIADFNRSKNTDKIDAFEEAYNPEDKDSIKSQLQKKLNISESEAENQINQKISWLESYLSNIDDIHKFYDGKRLIHHITQSYKNNQKGIFIKKDAFIRLLETSCSKGAPHPHLQDIIKNRILKISTRQTQ